MPRVADPARIKGRMASVRFPEAAWTLIEFAAASLLVTPSELIRDAAIAMAQAEIDAQERQRQAEAAE